MIQPGVSLKSHSHLDTVMGNEVSAAKPPAADGVGSEGEREEASCDKTMFVDRCCGDRHWNEGKLTFVESRRVERSQDGQSASCGNSRTPSCLPDVKHREQGLACWILEPEHVQERRLPAHTAAFAACVDPEEGELKSGMLLMHQVPLHFPSFMYPLNPAKLN